MGTPVKMERGSELCSTPERVRRGAKNKTW